MTQPIGYQAEMSLGDYISLFQRRRALVLWPVVVALAASVVYTLLTRPVYESSVRLLVEDASNTYTRNDAADPFSDVYSAAVHDVVTQVEMLQGRELLQTTFQEAKVPPKSVDVAVKRVFDSDVIQVVTRSETPDYAVRIAKALPAAYIRSTAGNHTSEIADALTFARRRLQQETSSLLAAEADLKRLHERSHIVNLDKQRDALIAAASEAADEVRRAELSVRGLEDQLREMLRLRGREPALQVTPTTVTNPNIALLQNRIDALRNERARLIVLYKPASTRVQEVDAQISELQGALARLPAVVTTTSTAPNPQIAVYDDRIGAARAQLTTRRGELAAARRASDDLQASLGRFNGLERQQVALERRIGRLRDSVALLSNSVDSLSLRGRSLHAPVSVISSASPAKKVHPKATRVYPSFLMLGLLAGIVLALIVDHLDQRVHSQVEVTRILESPVVGCVPFMPDKETRLLGSGASGAALESYRILQTNVVLSAANAPLRSILVCSSVPGEGKTLTACNLAVAMASEGNRVVLVDADLRAPSVHRVFNLKRDPGIADLLRGTASLDETLRDSGIPGLRILPGGTSLHGAASHLTPESLRRLHQDLLRLANVIIYDGPPLLGAADASTLSNTMDGVLFVVQMDGTRKPSLANAMGQLRNMRANVVGIVMNRVNPRSGEYSDYYSYADDRQVCIPGAFSSGDPASRNGSGDNLPEAPEGNSRVRVPPTKEDPGGPGQ